MNQLRAQQELTDLDWSKRARSCVYRAQEALGVLVVADGPVDALEEPAFDAAARSRSSWTIRRALLEPPTI